MRKSGYRESLDHQYCADCKEWVAPEEWDFGIGSYEYWGARGVDHDWRIVCPNCEGDNLQNFEED